MKTAQKNPPYSGLFCRRFRVDESNADQWLSVSCSKMAGFSSVEVSCVMASFFASERNKRRMILPERVLGKLSPKRMSLGLAMGPIYLPTLSRKIFAICLASSPVGRGRFNTTKAQMASPVVSSGRPTTAASATSSVQLTKADSISIVPMR